MEMTEQEIVASYKGAKDKSKQIGILAELNACDWQEIADILAAGGIQFQPKKRKSQGVPFTQQEKETILRLREKGKSFREIGAALGRTESGVRACAGRMKGQSAPIKQALELVGEVPIDHIWAGRVLRAVRENLGEDGKQTTARGLELATQLLEGGSGDV